MSTFNLDDEDTINIIPESSNRFGALKTVLLLLFAVSALIGTTIAGYFYAKNEAQSTQIVTLSAEIESLRKSVKGMDSGGPNDELLRHVKDLSTKVDSIEGTLDDMGADVQSIKLTVDSIESDVSSIQLRVGY